MTKQPIISVIVPCYNQGQYLAEALDSVLSSTLQEWECIIVNDGSTDNSLSIARKYESMDERFVVVDIPNGGLSNARNTGIKASHGKYILPLDSDDKIGPKYLQLAVEHLENHPETKLAYCLCHFFGDIAGFRKLPDYDYNFLIWCNVFFPACVYRRSEYDKTPGYNVNMKYGLEDWDFWLSLLDKDDKVYRIPDVQFFYRKHGISMIDGTKKRMSESLRQLVLNHIDIYKPHLGDMIEWHNELLHYKASYFGIRYSWSYRIGDTLLKPLKLLRTFYNAHRKDNLKIQTT